MTQQKTKNKFVKNTTQLKKLLSEGYHEYALLLAGGIAISYKTIKYSAWNHKFQIINHIDDSRQELTEKELKDREYTLIGATMPLKSLIAIIK